MVHASLKFPRGKLKILSLLPTTPLLFWVYFLEEGLRNKKIKTAASILGF